MSNKRKVSRRFSPQRELTHNASLVATRLGAMKLLSVSSVHPMAVATSFKGAVLAPTVAGAGPGAIVVRSNVTLQKRASTAKNFDKVATAVFIDYVNFARHRQNVSPTCC